MSLRGECHSSVRIEHSFLPFSSTPSIRILILLQDTLSPSSTSSLFHPLTCSLPHVILPNPILESSTSFFPHPSFALSLHLSSSVLSERERERARMRDTKREKKIHYSSHFFMSLFPCLFLLLSILLLFHFIIMILILFSRRAASTSFSSLFSSLFSSNFLMTNL